MLNKTIKLQNREWHLRRSSFGTFEAIFNHFPTNSLEVNLNSACKEEIINRENCGLWYKLLAEISTNYIPLDAFE